MDIGKSENSEKAGDLGLEKLAEIKGGQPRSTKVVLERMILSTLLSESLDIHYYHSWYHHL